MFWFIFTLLILAVSAAPGVQNCADQSISVTNKWTLPTTMVTTKGPCHYKFTIPQDEFALVDLEIRGANMTNLYIDDGYSDHIKAITLGYPANYSKILAIPSGFTISLDAPRPVQIQIKVTTKTATPQLVGKITTDLDGNSSVLYFEKWKPGTSYTITSKSDKGKVSLSADLNYEADEIDLENIFLYDGGELVGTLFTVKESMTYVSKTNKVTLYMANQITGNSGVVLITDYANTERFYQYQVVFDERVRRGVFHSVTGSADKPGAITLVGDYDGSFPFTLEDFSTKGDGQWTYSIGGPFVNVMMGISEINLPKKLSGNINTIYLSKGKGSVGYKRDD